MHARARGQQDGGSWGQRLLDLPACRARWEDRLRFMGLYHSPFNDLALPVLGSAAAVRSASAVGVAGAGVAAARLHLSGAAGTRVRAGRQLSACAAEVAALPTMRS